MIAMDIQLPGMDGLEATRRIMSRNPVPIVVVAACTESGGWNTIPMEALRAGALTVLEKPAGTTHADYEKVAERLCTQLVIMSQVKLVRRNGDCNPASSAGSCREGFDRAAGNVQDAGNYLFHRRPRCSGATAEGAGIGFPFADPAGPAHDCQLHRRGSLRGLIASARFEWW